MLDYFLDKVFRQVESSHNGTSFYIFEGVPITFLLKFAERVPFFTPEENLFCDNNSRIDLDYIYNHELELISGVRKHPPAKALILYEEFLVILKNRSLLRNQFSDINFYLYSNNLFDEFPNQSNQASPDYDSDEILSHLPEENEVFNSFYCYSRKADQPGQMLIRYLQFETGDLDNVKVADLFPVENLPSPVWIPFSEKDTGDVITDVAGLFGMLLKNIYSGNDVTANSVEVPEHLNESLELKLKIIHSIFTSNELPFKFFKREPEYLPEFRDELLPLLHAHWGKGSSFRNLDFYAKPYFDRQSVSISQGAIIEFVIKQAEKALQNDDTATGGFQNIFLTAPTGSGKSILFQIPALYLARMHPEKPVTIVIQPLTALVRNMYYNLVNQGISECTFLDSGITYAERDLRIEKIQQGEVSLLFLSPELFMSFQNLGFLGNRKLGLLVIDESHTVCTWGKEFRSDYWNLGRYVQKIKKYNYEFPIFAVTATAIYGGDNDMVTEIIKSLKIDFPQPQIYIGNVRRDYIEFIVSPFQFSSRPNYENEKKENTKLSIEQLIQNNRKSIVYFPWVKTLEDINTRIISNLKSKIAIYTAKMSSEAKDSSIKRFIENDVTVMLATKAFGMGVDIQDIMTVYHHAPSGTFADYIQEIGRLRREIKNNYEVIKHAEIDYSVKDLDYSKRLFMMSSIKQYQVRLALQKINALYKSKKTNSRNFLISLDDFSFIFDEDNDDKIKRMLIMIEEELEPHLIIRPRTIFSSVYAIIPNRIMDAFLRKYGKFSKKAGNLSNGHQIFSLELDKIWEHHFNHRTFPEIKRDFFRKKLFTEFISVNENDPDYKLYLVSPQLKLEMELESTPGSILITLNAYLEGLQRVLYNIGSHYFKKSRLDEELELIILDKELRNRFTELVLNIFGHPFGEARPATFFRYINRSKENDEEREFLTDFADLLKVKESLLGWCTFLTRIGEKSITRFISVNDEKNAIAVKTLYLIEFFNLGTYSLSGGENPMIFIRVNDPDKLDRLASNRYYNNRNVTKLYQRHLASNEVFNYFFTQISTSKERWDFIEGYFLGKDSNQDEDDRPMMQIKLVRPTGLNNGAYLSSLYWFLEEVYRLPEKADFKIDFSDIDFVVPSFILPVAVILAQQKQKEIQVKLLHSNGLKGYLQTIYFEEGGRQLSLEKSYKDVFETFTDKNYLGIFCVPATKDKLSLEFTESVLSHFKKTLITKLDLPMAVQSAVHYLVSEIFDNVIQHSGSEKFWIFAQYYPNKEYFDICIIDTGKGLLNSYLDNGYDEITTDIEAIEHAVNGYSTKEYYNERGKGMSTSRKMVVEGLDGDFIVISGNALFYNDKIIMAPVSWLGTIVSLRLPKFKSNFDYIMYIE